MEWNEISVGMAVVPISKSVGGNSFERIRQLMSQYTDEYLIVDNINFLCEGTPCIVAGKNIGRRWFFKPYDLVPYKLNSDHERWFINKN